MRFVDAFSVRTADADHSTHTPVRAAGHHGKVEAAGRG